jgi:hypothetical protein
MINAGLLGNALICAQNVERNIISERQQVWSALFSILCNLNSYTLVEAPFISKEIEKDILSIIIMAQRAMIRLGESPRHLIQFSFT